MNWNSSSSGYFLSMLCHFNETREEKAKNDINSFRYLETWHNQHTSSSVHDMNLSCDTLHFELTDFPSPSLLFCCLRKSSNEECVLEFSIFVALLSVFIFRFVFSPSKDKFFNGDEDKQDHNVAWFKFLCPPRFFAVHCFRSTSKRPSVSECESERNSIDKILKRNI